MSTEEKIMKENSTEKIVLGGAFIGAIAASLCCILPVIAVALGLGAFGMAAVFESLRPYLLVVVGLALAVSFYRIYFRREECGEGQACSTKPIRRFNQIAFWAATGVVIGIAAFPYYSGSIVSALDNGQPQAAETENSVLAAEVPGEGPVAQNVTSTEAIEAESQNRKTIVIAVEGMTCEGCAAQLNVALKRLKGVISAEANYSQKNVKVVYNPKYVTVDRIKKAIYDAGYTPR
jgi:mercuric ion transport protein